MSFDDTSSINGRITIRFKKLFTLAATAANIFFFSSKKCSFQDFAGTQQQQLRSNESVFFSIFQFTLIGAELQQKSVQPSQP